MGKILRLPSELANQIAAGEVVERPASVVKELVENAIDAGARRLSIHTELGGKKQVRVEDDGEGMAPDDARVAIERHATSKIARADDLAAIRTLGFRGEALPSIASVSHFVLRTRARGAGSGTEVRVNGGTVASVTEAGIPEGTAVEVNDVFYNLPARRKFLKSDAAESAQVSRVVTQLALAYHEIGFDLTSAGRTVLQYPPAASPRERLFQIYGERDDLVEVRKEAGGVKLTGFVAALADHGSQAPTRGPQHVFVNRRIVKDRTIAHAIIDAYSVASIKERSPEVHLFIEMPLDAVDVNVHPTKAEVRFRDQSMVHEVVRRALMEALGRTGAPQLQLQSEWPGGRSPTTPALPGVLAGGAYPNRWVPGASTFSEAASTFSGVASTFSEAASTVSEAAVTLSVKPLIPLGQFRDTFIIAVDDEGVAIVDQHVAHERVLFERVMEKLTAGRLESQRLLVPMLIDLPPAAHEVLAARAVELERFGFDIEPFGTATIKVTAVPALLRTEDSANALLALAEDLEGLDRGAHVHDALKRIAATTACHAAVKANYPLTYEKMTHILDELRATAYSTICPHGRPVMLRLTRREIEKNFERI
ncbi:MAG TPA: DNA mismatch repair endonuclease MutL [Vicinamibacterales bacterium]|jgi:DNA mismatch repair protein MutL|nr:DNA mismatch repair endonuclease MutL [Vicinamibacterales bacterium]